MSDFDRFLTPKNFELAFFRLKTAQRNLYKTLYYSDLKIFEVFLNENISSLIHSIEQDYYSPQKCHKIFIPKKNNLVRPLSLLNFIDLLVYQSIVNTISDEVYDKIEPYYNNIIYGNLVNTSNAPDKQFFYKSWKKRWKNFNKRTEAYYNEGYRFLSEFDIASFFDTIDHSILIQILDKEYGIDEDLLAFLSKCLEMWTGDSNHNTFNSKHGIPQGPLASPFLADLYLLHLDLQITKQKRLEIKYIRYVDDIRIFSKNKLTAQKAIAALDLLARDLGLIPQGSKILIKEITDIQLELRHIKNNFSLINKEFKAKNGLLKNKTHRKLKKRFFNSFDLNNKESEIAKTIVGFSLYKLNKDEQVKQKLIDSFYELFTHAEGILFYFGKHYSNDEEVISFLLKLMNDKDILFHHIIALIFKYFPQIGFNEEVFERYIFDNHRHWLVKYYMIDWLYENSQKELILTMKSQNPIIERKLNDFRFRISKSRTYQKIFSKKLLEEKDTLIALQGIFLLFRVRGFFWFYNVPKKNHYNEFISRIMGGRKSDYINYTLKHEFNIDDSESFFNTSIWNKKEEYGELKSAFLAYNRNRNNSPTIAIIQLNFFNHLIFDKICERLNIIKPSKDYGVNLGSDIIKFKLPFTNRYWKEINMKRNQKSEAHPYDKYGNLRVKITYSELDEVHKKEIKTLEEICTLKQF